MYALLWRSLPGPIPVKLLLALLLFLLVVAFLFLVVFPWVVPLLPFNDVTVEEAGAIGPLWR